MSQCYGSTFYDLLERDNQSGSKTDNGLRKTDKVSKNRICSAEGGSYVLVFTTMSYGNDLSTSLLVRNSNGWQTVGKSYA